MPNVNCLEGVKCPECGNEDRFLIAARILADVTDGGADIADKGRGNIEWDDESHAECAACTRYGKLKDFKAE